jgi:hypothetical protein
MMSSNLTVEPFGADRSSGIVIFAGVALDINNWIEMRPMQRAALVKAR